MDDSALCEHERASGMFSDGDNKGHADSCVTIANPELVDALLVNALTVKTIGCSPAGTIKGAMVKAARNGLHEHMVGLLYAGAGDVNEVYQKETPLYCASRRGDTNMVQTLLSFRAVPDDPHRAPRRIALHAAARYIRWCISAMSSHLCAVAENRVDPFEGGGKKSLHEPTQTSCHESYSPRKAQKSSMAWVMRLPLNLTRRNISTVLSRWCRRAFTGVSS